MKKKQLNNWLIVAVIFFIFLLPFFSARWFYDKHALQVLHTLGTVNQGMLIQPPMVLQSLLKDPAQKITLEKKWYIMYVVKTEGGRSTQQALDKIQRIRLSLGKDFSQTGMLLISTEKQNIPDMPDMLEIRLSESGINKLLKYSNGDQGIFLMDPEKNIMMAYLANVNSEAIYKDMRRLLKYRGNDA